MKYKDRFIYGFTPEDAKQADLMFVQHMLASCDENKGGRVVVVMPHGVLFRGRKEKKSVLPCFSATLMCLKV